MAGMKSVAMTMEELAIPLTLASSLPGASAQKAFENPTPEVKQEVLRLLVESIVVEENAITIKHIIPTDDNSRLLPQGIMQKHPISDENDIGHTLLPMIFAEVYYPMCRLCWLV